MKYNTLLVPAVAFATLAIALPTDRYPSDQGDYQPRPQDNKSALKQAGAPIPDAADAPLAGAMNNAGGVPGRAQSFLPVSAPGSSSKKGPSSSGFPVNMVTSGGAPNPVGVAGGVAGTVAGVAGGVAGTVLSHKPSTDSEPFDMLPFSPEEVPSEAVGMTPAGSVSPPVDAPGLLPDFLRELLPIEKRDNTTTVSCGNVRVEASDNKFSGFISAERDDNGRYTVVANATDAVVVDLVGYDLTFRDAEVLYPVLGATFGVTYDNNTAQDNLQGNSANFAMLTGTSKTEHGQRDVDGESSFNDATGASQKIESAIYYMGENNEIRAAWTNTDGASIPAGFAVNYDSQIILSGNVGQYAATYGGDSARLFCVADSADDTN